MDARSEKTRMNFARNLNQNAGFSFKDQQNLTGSVSSKWASITKPINDQRRNCQESIGLQNRYLMVIGMTFLPLLILKKRRIRRMAQFWALSTWFACPEWYRAYWTPKRTYNQLLAAEAGETSETVSTPAVVKKEEVTPATKATPTVRVSKATTAPAAKTSIVDQMRKDAADRIANEKTLRDLIAQAEKAD